jgi:hypothetical protein
MIQKVWCITNFLPKAMGPHHQSDCLHTESAMSLRNSSLDTASLIAFGTASFFGQCSVPSSNECQGLLGTAQHFSGFKFALPTTFGTLWLICAPQAEDHIEGEKISRHTTDTTEYYTQMLAIPKGPTTDALKSRRITGITAHNLEHPTLKEKSQ